MIRLPASYARLTGEKPPAKYHNIKVNSPDGAFDSKREFARWCQLRIEQRAGLIQNLRRQVRYPLMVNGVKIAVYVADMVYERGGVTVVEDVKGYLISKEFRIKRKLMKALHNIDVKVVQE